MSKEGPSDRTRSNRMKSFDEENKDMKDSINLHNNFQKNMS